jgi:glycosyltransferase involved in cell wall biosynthesis
MLNITQPSVLVVQRRLTHYRVPLFEALRALLAERNIKLEVLVGQGTPAEERKHDAGELPWAKPIPTRYLVGGRLCWQPVHSQLGGASLVIVTQENKLIQNHLLLLAPRRFKLAFWGHGANLQSDNPHGFKERFKRWTTNRVDWWFAYTQMSANLVSAVGFPKDRITVLNNAVDTCEMQRQRQSITKEETQALRESLGFGAGPVGVFVGSLYADKKLGFIFKSAEAIRREVPDFHLLIVGDGQERDKVQAWCAANPWARWVGARFGREKIAFVSVAQVMLNPGALGLGVMDSFACQTPMITTDCGNHGPEIAYLVSGVNGVVTRDDLDAYVDATVNLLRDVAALDTLRAGCAASAMEFSLENMVRHFADGVTQCLAAPRNDGQCC